MKERGAERVPRPRGYKYGERDHRQNLTLASLILSAGHQARGTSNTMKVSAIQELCKLFWWKSVSANTFPFSSLVLHVIYGRFLKNLGLIFNFDHSVWTTSKDHLDYFM